MDVTLVQVPYDSGHHRARMGRGPLHLLKCGLDRDLLNSGHAVHRVEVVLPEGFHHEVGAAALLYREVRRAVLEARQADRFPVVLTGKCNAAALRTVAALSADEAPGSTGVVWLDAHGDFNTPETSPSGFFDGMALSVLTGGCWRAWTTSLPGYMPVAEDRVLLVGARDLDPAEKDLLDASEVARVSVDALRREKGGASAEGGLAPRLEALGGRADHAYLHLDLDVLDPQEGRANSFAAAGGLRPGEVHHLIRTVADRLPLAAASLTSFDPTADPTERTTAAGKRLVLAMTDAAERPRDSPAARPGVSSDDR